MFLYNIFSIYTTEPHIIMADNNEQSKTTTVVTKPNSADPAVERKLREMKSHFPLKEQEAHYLVCNMHNIDRMGY